MREDARFQVYRKKQLAEMRPYEPGEDMTGISVNDVDKANGSPMEGDLIARNPKDHADQWLVSGKFAADNYETVDPVPATED